jgi:hypothetical protein
MGRVKDRFIEIEEALRAGEWQRVIELLEPWGDEAPAALLNFVEWAALGQIDHRDQGGESV